VSVHLPVRVTVLQADKKAMQQSVRKHCSWALIWAVCYDGIFSDLQSSAFSSYYMQSGSTLRFPFSV